MWVKAKLHKEIAIADITHLFNNLYTQNVYKYNNKLLIIVQLNAS